MIHFITNNKYSGSFKQISVEDCLNALSTLEVIGVDTETTGLNPHKDKILSLQLGNKDNQYVIDCTTVNVELFRPLLEDKSKLFLFWNAKFDLQFLMKHRILPWKVWDGYVVEELMHLGLLSKDYSASLKTACKTYLGVNMDKTVRGQIRYKGLSEDVIKYAANDVVYLERIMELQKAKLKRLGLSKAVEYENRFVIPLSYMEFCGIRIDVKKWKEKMRKDNERRDRALLECNLWLINHFKDGDSIVVDKGPMRIPKSQAQLLDPSEYTVTETKSVGKDGTVKVSQIYYSKTRRSLETIQIVSSNYAGSLFGDDKPMCTIGINWKSSQHMKALFHRLGVEVDEGVDAKLLKKQMSKCSLIAPYIKYREAVKVTSTYGQNFLDQTDPETGRVHTNYFQFGTRTGRISSGSKETDEDEWGSVEKDKKVNLLNLPKDEETRACFVSEEGNRFISIDYSGQESFIMADITGDPEMLRELNEGEGDMHTLAAKMLYNQIPKDMKASDVKKNFHNERQRAKSLEFAVFYGSQGKAIARNLNLTDEEAALLYNKFMSGFKGLNDYQNYRRKDWLNKGYILINKKTGHKSFISDINWIKDCAKKFSGNDFWNNYRSIKHDIHNPLVKEVKSYFKHRSGLERDSINYPVQGCGALCMKTAMINFFNWVRKNGLLYKVLLCVMPYDECCFEAPNDVAQEAADKMHDCMVKSGAYFVTKCHLDAEISYDENGKLPNYWIH